MYVAVKGGEKAIENAHRLTAEMRRGNPAVTEIEVAQIESQLKLAVDRVISEGALYDRELAAVAIKQARGDLVEAIFLVRAFRTTLPHLGCSEPLDTTSMQTLRRISAIFKDIPGGQVLGPTFDYSHRLIDFDLLEDGDAPEEKTQAGGDPVDGCMSRVLAVLGQEGVVEPADGLESIQEAPAEDVGDITREPLSFPAGRDVRLQSLARGDEGFLLALGYSSQRGYGRTHPFAGEIRFGEVMVALVPPELGFAVEIAAIDVTECEMVNQFAGSVEVDPTFTRGYGLVFGQLERKAMSMALVDRALRTRELGEEMEAPVQDEEFVLSHMDNVQATGFVEHLKLPHYVDFQSELELVRRLRAERSARKEAAE